MAEVVLPRSLAVLIPGLPHRATVDGSTVAEVIAGLDRAWPGVADRLLEAGPAIREHINVFVDGENIRHTGGLDTPVGESGELTILPAISGG